MINAMIGLLLNKGPIFISRWKRNKWFTVAKAFGVLFGLGVFVITITTNITRLTTISPHYNWNALFLSSIVLMFTTGIGISAWVGIICTLRPDITVVRAVKSHLLTTPAKYLPGIALNQVGKVVYLRGQNIEDDALTTLASGIEIMITMSSGILVTTCISLAWNITLFGMSANDIKLSILLATLLFCISLPIVLVRWLAGKRYCNLPDRQGLFLCKLYLVEGLFCVGWVTLGIAFWATANVFVEVSPSALPACISTLAVSWVMGMVAIFAPNGIGIRELALTQGLSGILEPHFVIFGSIFIRLQIIVIDMIAFSLTVITGNKHRK